MLLQTYLSDDGMERINNQSPPKAPLADIGLGEDVSDYFCNFLKHTMRH